MTKFLFALMLAFVLAACGRKPETPEEAMKAQLDNPIAMYDDKSIFHRGAKSVAWLVANKAGHEAAIKAAVLRIKDRHFTSDMEKALGMQLR